MRPPQKEMSVTEEIDLGGRLEVGHVDAQLVPQHAYAFLYFTRMQKKGVQENCVFHNSLQSPPSPTLL